jgi:hypothetical protein
MLGHAASRIMPRTTIDLDPGVLKELRRRGHQEGKSMGQVASEILAQALAEPPLPGEPFGWSTGRLGVPRVDLEDREAVRAVLESDA